MQRRSWWMAGVGVVATATGASLAWWRLRPHPPEGLEPTHWDSLWQLPFKTRDGRELLLQRNKGQKILVNFWATWCPPCVAEMPLLDRFYRENQAHGWQVVGIAADQETSVSNFVQKHDIRFPIAVNGVQGVELSRALGNSAGGLPFTVVLDEHGKIAAQRLGKISEDDLAKWKTL